MMDLSLTIVPKSDQLNTDDLIAGPLTIHVTEVTATGEPEQPISIHFDGDGDKPYKPCKSMRRVLVQIWGRDGSLYPGRSMTLYRDPRVTWGGLAVGGIRISHMSHMTDEITMALTESKKARKPYTVKPLVVERKKSVKDWLDELETELQAAGPEGREAIVAREDVRKALGALRGGPLARLTAMVSARPREEAGEIIGDDRHPIDGGGMMTAGESPRRFDTPDPAAAIISRVAELDLIAIRRLATDAQHRAEMKALPTDEDRARVEAAIQARLTA